MRRIAEQRNVRVAAFMSCLLLAYAATADDEVNLAHARVELTVRGSDGRPVAGKTVVVHDGSKDYFQSDNRPSATVKSDAQGHIAVDWPVGLRRLSSRLCTIAP